jgi:hypothetical protein
MGYKLRVPYAGSSVQVNDILEKVRPATHSADFLYFLIMFVMPVQLCDSAWSDFVWVDGSALFEKRNAAVEYPASAASDAGAALRRECDHFVSAAEDAAPKSISTLKHDVGASATYLCEDSLRSCKKGGVVQEQLRAADLSAARAKAAEEKAAAEAAAKEASRQRELEAASAAVASESLVPYADKYSIHSGLSASHFTALGMAASDAEKVALMVTKDLQAKAEAKAAEEAAAAAAAAAAQAAADAAAEAAAAQAAKAAEEVKAAAEAATSRTEGSSESQDSPAPASQAHSDERTGVVGGILDSIGSFFSEPAAPSAPDL